MNLPATVPPGASTPGAASNWLDLTMTYDADTNMYYAFARSATAADSPGDNADDWCNVLSCSTVNGTFSYFLVRNWTGKFSAANFEAPRILRDKVKNVWRLYTDQISPHGMYYLEQNIDINHDWRGDNTNAWTSLAALNMPLSSGPRNGKAVYMP
jgi:hypothetical protein